MVQLKYFGDSRDYFKYDLIAFLLQRSTLKNYVFVPMLTNHRVDGEGNLLPRPAEGKSPDLLSFIQACGSKDLNHWQKWLEPHVEQYNTIQPVNKTFFDDNSRSEYWRLFTSLLRKQNALVFIDPDTGLVTGSESYLLKMGKEKYIGNGELRYIFDKIDESSVLMIYQHLPRNKKMHLGSVAKKLTQAERVTMCSYLMAYREDDLAFVFMMKSESAYSSISELLENYHDQSGHKHSSMHYSQSRSNQAKGETSSPSK